MTRVYLHIGAPKTGTTYLQEVLFRNRTLLAEHGLCYPGQTSAAHYAAVLDLRGLDFGGYDDPDAEGAWEAVASAARGWRGEAVVISHELLGAAKPPAIERALDDLRGHEVHVVMTARDLGRQVPAVWQEMVKNNQVVDYPTYLQQLVDHKGRSARVFWRQQDIVEVLGNWSEFVPGTQVHLATVPPAGASSTLLWERFCSVVGIVPAGYETTVPRTNASLGLAEAELVRRINVALDGRLAWPQFAPTVKFWFAEQLLGERRDTERVRVPDDLRSWFDDKAASMVAEVRRRGYPVVGNLSDLTPVYGTDQPDAEPDPDAVVDAAAAALAEMLTDRAHGSQRMVQGVADRLRGPSRRRVLRMLPEPVKARLRRAAGH